MSTFDLSRSGRYDFEFGVPVREYRLHPGLEIINLERNRFEELPESIKETQVRQLNIEGNAIKWLPELPATLQELKAGHNALTARSFDLVLPHFQALVRLELDHNRLQSFPDHLVMSTLTHLDISGNFLTEINFRTPPKLVYFNASDNRLTALSDDIPATLREYYVQDNQVAVLPPSIMNATELVELNYEHNGPIYVSEDVLEYINTVMERRRIRETLEEQRRQVQVADRVLGRAQVADRVPGGAQVADRVPGGAQVADRVLGGARWGIPARRTVYGDAQNVHTSHITKEVKEHIERLQAEFAEDCRGVALDDMLKAFLDEFWGVTSRASRNRLDTICSTRGTHSQLGLSLSEIFCLVWNKARKLELVEIAKVIEGDLFDMERVCFTGRASRLVNSLSGFDEAFQIGVDQTTQIQAKFEVVKRWLERVGLGEGSDRYQFCLFIRFRTLLREIELEQDTIDVWLTPFEELPVQEIVERDHEYLQGVLDAPELEELGIPKE